MTLSRTSMVLDVEEMASFGRDFYARPVLAVARDLVGAILVHRTREGTAAGRIVEAEAYRGPEDLAAHSARGLRTKRTEAMWGPPGHAYVYLLYGMHWAFNVVTGAAGQPHAVLVRAVEPLPPYELMLARRGLDKVKRELTAGPGRVCAALGIGAAQYGADLCGRELFLSPGPRGRVARSPRINVDYAGSWANKPWRFYERQSRWISVPPRD
jgi:DNA-3-methyladenine glycosylase